MVRMVREAVMFLPLAAVREGRARAAKLGTPNGGNKSRKRQSRGSLSLRHPENG
jgi:hypothetical protein